jgi:hypothetical protein
MCNLQGQQVLSNMEVSTTLPLFYIVYCFPTRGAVQHAFCSKCLQVDTTTIAAVLWPPEGMADMPKLPAIPESLASPAAKRRAALAPAGSPAAKKQAAHIRADSMAAKGALALANSGVPTKKRRGLRQQVRLRGHPHAVLMVRISTALAMFFTTK